MKLATPAWPAGAVMLWLGLATIADAQAAEGVSGSGRIIVGQSADLSGPMAETGEFFSLGMRLHFERVNAAGGVHGREIQLVTLDDGFDERRALQNTRVLIEDKHALALIGYIGAGPAMAAVPLSDSSGTPFIAPYTGAESLRKQGRWLFHVRASHGDEINKIVEHLATIGSRTVAIAYQDDILSPSDRQSIASALLKHGLRGVAEAHIDTRLSNVAQAAETVAKTNPDAVILALDNRFATTFIRGCLARSNSSRPHFYGLSLLSAKHLHRELERAAAGISLTQVVPSPWSERHATVRQYRRVLNQAYGVVRKNRDMAAKASPQDPHHAALEGWIAAQVLVEGLRRAGSHPTRDRLANALESLSDYDVGGFSVAYSRERHVGSSFVDLSIILGNGRLQQ